MSISWKAVSGPWGLHLRLADLSSSGEESTNPSATDQPPLAVYVIGNLGPALFKCYNLDPVRSDAYDDRADDPPVAASEFATTTYQEKITLCTHCES